MFIEYLQFFIRHVRNHEYLRRSERAQLLLDETLKFMSELDNIEQMTQEIKMPKYAIPRLPYKIVFTIGGWYDGQPRCLIETYDTRADRWITITDQCRSGPRAYHGCVAIGRKIYCIGGFNGVEHFNVCSVFDVVRKEWREIAPMHHRRCYVAVCVLNGNIYAIGGHNGLRRLRSMERYCPETNQWTLLRPMSVERSDADACVLGGLIYVAGE